QFADELGTRLARATAYQAFVVLGASAVALIVLFFEYGRAWGGWVGYGYYPATGFLPLWWVPLMVVSFISAQIALAAGALALLRAWRLRHELVICAADAAVINRRSAVALVCGAITMLVPVLTRAVIWPGGEVGDWPTIGLTIGAVSIVMQLAMLPAVLVTARLRPVRSGQAGDLTADLGTTGTRFRPWHAAVSLSAAILVVLVLVGVRSDDPLAGVARGVFDAGACMTGFVVLGRYLGLRTAG
ncbi:MAG: hypothetical protein ACRDMJ_02800, partial [Solirubrobacteraceae bacterium]